MAITKQHVGSRAVIDTKLFVMAITIVAGIALTVLALAQINIIRVRVDPCRLRVDFVRPDGGLAPESGEMKSPIVIYSWLVSTVPKSGGIFPA